MFRLLVVVVLLSAVSAAIVKSDAEQLRDLLNKMRNLLNEETEKSTTRTTYDQPVTLYPDNGLAPDPSSGYWTKWINMDTNFYYGVGEYEDCSRIEWQQDIDRKCYKGCKTPIAAQYASAVQTTTATWDDIKNCIGSFDSNEANTCGFKCLNMDASNYPKAGCNLARCVEYGMGVNCTKCPDMRVKFFCTGDQPPEDQCCPYSTNCGQSSRKSLSVSLKESFSDVNERNDVVADILNEVRAVLDDKN